jgi:sarcosine oxidase subunit gamma
MSDLSPQPISALNRATFEGPLVSIAEAGPVGMITIRGDFSDAGFANAVEAAAGVAIPDVRMFAETEAGGLGWMSPDELLWVLPYSDALTAADDLSAVLAGTHHMVANVSDARTMLRVSGQAARELIAKGAPVDMSPAGFTPGNFRRSHIGQLAAAFWLGADERTITVVCFRSAGSYLFDWLSESGRDGGTPGLY